MKQSWLFCSQAVKQLLLPQVILRKTIKPCVHRIKAARILFNPGKGWKWHLCHLWHEQRNSVCRAGTAMSLPGSCFWMKDVCEWAAPGSCWCWGGALRRDQAVHPTKHQRLSLAGSHRCYLWWYWLWLQLPVLVQLLEALGRIVSTSEKNSYFGSCPGKCWKHSAHFSSSWGSQKWVSFKKSF